MALTAEQFKAEAAKRRPVVEHEIAGFGIVRLRALSAGDLLASEEIGSTDNDRAFYMIALSLLGENDDLLFPLDANGQPAEGIAVARGLDKDLYKDLTQKVTEINGLSPQAIETTEKN